MDCFKGKFAYGQIRKSRTSKPPLRQPFSPTRGWSGGNFRHRCHQETEKAAGSLPDPPSDDPVQNTALSFHEWTEKQSFVRKNTCLVSISFPKRVPIKAEKELARGQSCWFSDGPAIGLQTIEQVPAAQKTSSRPYSSPWQPHLPVGRGGSGDSANLSLRFSLRAGHG